MSRSSAEEAPTIVPNPSAGRREHLGELGAIDKDELMEGLKRVLPSSLQHVPVAAFQSSV